jgi:hypothetical protein
VLASLIRDAAHTWSIVHIEGGKHSAADVVAQAQAVLTEPELLRAMFDVGYFPRTRRRATLRWASPSSTAREYVARPFWRPSLLRRALDTHKSHAQHTLSGSPREFPKCRDEMAFPDA